MCRSAEPLNLKGGPLKHASLASSPAAATQKGRSGRKSTDARFFATPAKLPSVLPESHMMHLQKVSLLPSPAMQSFVESGDHTMSRTAPESTSPSYTVWCAPSSPGSTAHTITFPVTSPEQQKRPDGDTQHALTAYPCPSNTASTRIFPAAAAPAPSPSPPPPPPSSRSSTLFPDGYASTPPLDLNAPEHGRPRSGRGSGANTSFSVHAPAAIVDLDAIATALGSARRRQRAR